MVTSEFPTVLEPGEGPPARDYAQYSSAEPGPFVPGTGSRSVTHYLGYVVCVRLVEGCFRTKDPGYQVRLCPQK